MTTTHAPLIIDIAGTTLTDADRRRLRHPLVGGLILFARNWSDRPQLAALCADIRAVRSDLLICVDHEGGRVQRFKTDGFTHLPAMRRLGELWESEGRKHPSHCDDAHPTLTPAALRALDAATACGYVLASELRACGVDFSFTPVLDLDYQNSTVIGDRAFSGDARTVAALARALILGLHMAGMGHCGKHFPGHGWVAADSHTDIPVDNRSLADILLHDAAPYSWLNSTLMSVMPAHVIYSEIDSRPAGFSATWLKDILRIRLQFDGAIFSDDLSMEAARVLPDVNDGQPMRYGQAALQALAAGCDLVLLCNQSIVEDGAPIDQMIDELSAARDAGLWQPDAHSERRRQHLLPRGTAPSWDDLMRQPQYRRALELLP